MDDTNLTAVSPIDGRYANKVSALSDYFSEMALMKYRVLVEIKWFVFLSQHPEFDALPALNATEIKALNHIIDNFNIEAAKQIKAHEARCNHDVKSVEYYLRSSLENTLGDRIELLHFACTSEDINNLAYALMVQDSLKNQLLPTLKELMQHLMGLAKKHKSEPMLCRTHGQPATPSTLGKEFANFVYRLQSIYDKLNPALLSGKFNGATGNYNAHLTAFSNHKLDRFIKTVY